MRKALEHEGGFPAGRVGGHHRGYGLETFIEVGQGIIEIRDKRLYRGRSSKSFETYCKAKWDFTGRRARQLIGVAQIGTVVRVATKPRPVP